MLNYFQPLPDGIWRYYNKMKVVKQVLYVKDIQECGKLRYKKVRVTLNYDTKILSTGVYIL